MRHLGDWTAYWSARTPSAIALSEPEEGKSATWRELDRRSNRLAHALSSLGVARGERVAVLAHNRLEHFELFFACAKLGALFAPLNWRLAAAELDVVLADCAPRVFLYDRACAPLAAQLSTPVEERIALDAPEAGGRSYEALLALGSDGAAGDARVGLEDALMLCYTSGTTGRPKGALLSHRQLLFNSLSTELAIGVGRTDSTLVFMPLFHTGGMNCLATPILHHGGRVVVMRGFDAERALVLSAEERVTLQMGVPTIFEMMRDAPSFAKVDLSSTRMALCGGAPCPLPLIDTYRERGVLFRQGFGMTEVGPNCFSLTEEDAFRKAGSVGWPNFYLRARVVDDGGNEVGSHVDGELWLSGPMVTIGYFRNQPATDAAFAIDGNGDRWFKTGDLVRKDDEGYHFIVGRKKDMFISGGENVYPAEVELAMAALDGVAEVCVIGVPDARWGEVGRAVIVPRPGAPVDGAAILRALDGKLARYKIPKSVVFAEALPRNASGKVLRHEVRAAFG
jgi:fatty-acyl-CoA synthase